MQHRQRNNTKIETSLLLSSDDETMLHSNSKNHYFHLKSEHIYNKMSYFCQLTDYKQQISKQEARGCEFYFVMRLKISLELKGHCFIQDTISWLISICFIKSRFDTKKAPN